METLAVLNVNTMFLVAVGEMLVVLVTKAFALPGRKLDVMGVVLVVPMVASVVIVMIVFRVATEATVVRFVN